MLVRTDSGGGTRGSLQRLTAPSRRLHYSLGMTITEDMQDAVLKVPADSWTPAYDGDGRVRDGAWVADITGMLDLSSWPAGMRLIVRKERPHLGAQLRFTDIDGHRFTAFATDAKKGQLADLELLTLTGPARRWEPRRLRLRLFSVTGRLVRGGRRLRLRLAQRWPWAGLVTATVSRLQLSRPADQPQPPLRPGKDNTRGPWNPRPPGATTGQPATASP